MSPTRATRLTDEQLKTFASSAPAEQLDEVFQKIWQEIRAARHLPGQPRNDASTQSVTIANIALQLATWSGREQLLMEAWHMMAHSLMANEQYEEAIPYYETRIQHLDRKPDRQNAARARQGYVLALLHAGKYDEALAAGAVAEKWFRENNDELNLARVARTSATYFIASTTTSKRTGITPPLAKSLPDSMTRARLPRSV